MEKTLLGTDHSTPIDVILNLCQFKLNQGSLRKLVHLLFMSPPGHHYCTHDGY